MSKYIYLFILEMFNKCFLFLDLHKIIVIF